MTTKKIDTRRRRARRKMAWTALISMLVATTLVFFIVPETRLSLIDNLLTWFFSIMGSIVLAYLGVATWFDVKNITKPDITKTNSTESEEESEI